MSSQPLPVVLLVEDDDAIRDLSEMILDMEGYEVHSVRNGDEAEHWLATGKADVLFTDINMPGRIGGQELAIRHHDMRVLVTSGEAPEQHDWLRPGMRYLAKPYDRKTLLNAIRDLAA
ncbi:MULTISPECIES: response regulator [unclassified Luteibacter]|uniref:response regulator n=1 Tax=unclassified Luteibacter TaxID=2620188 RepID=UPI0008D34EF1|nr:MULTISPECIES: response regulator [unclassified Luteibacter]MDR6938227.1 DNA-binding NtrC family response regulator [Luteibacter sp. 3190]SEP09415.1 Response regulator receiver domain-containing protein [Luteibacter sp. UNC138MFCol5.1]SEW06176.1 Response regulator receiver domain-containing protein [Luteibacter sp. 329MFSha]